MMQKFFKKSSKNKSNIKFSNVVFARNALDMRSNPEQVPYDANSLTAGSVFGIL